MTLSETKAAILAALENGPLSRTKLHHDIPGPFRIALRQLRQSGEVVMIGNTRGAKYALAEEVAS